MEMKGDGSVAGFMVIPAGCKREFIFSSSVLSAGKKRVFIFIYSYPLERKTPIPFSSEVVFA
jgi:hypothetical protein